MIIYNYLYQPPVVTVAELNCHHLICSSSEHSVFISPLRKDIFVATENTFLSINALEHVVRIKMVKGHYLQAESETHVICAQEFY